MKKLLAQVMCAFALLSVLGAVVPASAQVTTFVTFNRSLGQIPESIAIDKTGNIYVPFAFAHSVGKVTPAGVVSTLAVLPASNLVGGVTTDPSANVYALENAFSSVFKGVWRITPDGAETLLAGFPTAKVGLRLKRRPYKPCSRDWKCSADL